MAPAEGASEQRDAAGDAAALALLSSDGQTEAQQLQIAEPSNGPAKRSCAGLPLRQHWPLLVSLWLTHVSIGIASALPGSSLVQLASQVGASLSTMGFWFTAKSLASCVLALLTGFLFTRLPGSGAARAAFLAAGNAVCAGALLGASLTRSCALALCLAAALGSGHGALETANGILTIHVFGSHNSRPILHSLHLCTALGGLMAPLLLSSFGTRGTGNATWLAASNASDNGTIPWDAGGGICNGSGGGGGGGGGGNDSASSAIAAVEAAPPLQLIGPYSVLFTVQIAVSVGLLILAVRGYRMIPLIERAPHASSAATGNTTLSVQTQPLMTAWRQRLLVSLTVVFYFSAVGGENIFWSLVTAYGMCSPTLRLDARNAAVLHATFFGGFLVGRCLGVAVAHWARPTVIMLAHMTGCLLALVTLCLAAAPWLTYAGTAAFGLCISVLYATGVTWLEQRIDVIGPVACSWSIGGQLGISVLPALAGHLLVSPATGPAAVMYMTLGAMVTAAATFLLMLLLAGRLQRRRPKVP